MSDIKDMAEAGKTAWESFKKVFSLLKERKLFAAFRQCFSFLKAVYVNHLKGKYITVKGKKIPRTLIAILVLFFGYCALPSDDNNVSSELSEAADTQKDSNTYDNEGVKIYDMRRCELDNKIGACGYLENYGEYNFGRIKVIITFFAPEGTPIYEGGIEAEGVESHTRSKINVACPDEFSYFNIKEVTLEDKTEAQ